MNSDQIAQKNRASFPLSDCIERKCVEAYFRVKKCYSHYFWYAQSSCLIFDGSGHVIAEKTDCTEANLIEIAAYDYDDGRKSFQNIEILMKYFSRK